MSVLINALELLRSTLLEKLLIIPLVSIVDVFTQQLLYLTVE
jgi:hypothetical protein